MAVFLLSFFIFDNMNSTRNNIVAANWKMNKTLEEVIQFADEINSIGLPKNITSIIAPPALYLNTLKQKLTTIKLAAQDCSAYEKGAYTGELSAAMIRSCGGSYIIIGHSERRIYHKENNELLKQKLVQVLNFGLSPIYCIGETLEERNTGKQLEVVSSQIEEALFSFSSEELKKLVLAYEPVWAIGTGFTATSAQAQEMHTFIRGFIAKKYGKEFAQNMSILYGGSCNPGNAKELFACADIDGGLIGGASLNVKDLTAIINSF